MAKLLNGVYLAGPMAGLSSDEMKGWRNRARLDFVAADIMFLDPARRVTYHQQVLEDSGHEINISKRIFKQDLRDISVCDAMLVDMRHHEKAKGQGTAAEVMFAHTENKIIIMFKRPDDDLNPFMAAMATEVHDSLDDAIYAIMEYTT
jgi:nucleoside 2-deoxyribosyltransferase